MVIGMQNLHIFTITAINLNTYQSMQMCNFWHDTGWQSKEKSTLVNLVCLMPKGHSESHAPILRMADYKN